MSEEAGVLSISDLPQNFIDDITSKLLHYSVGIIRFRNNRSHVDALILSENTRGIACLAVLIESIHPGIMIIWN